MKLRLYRNSIRFRLSPGEVEQLHQRGSLSESISITPNVDFVYGLHSRPIAAAKVTFDSKTLAVELPQTAVAHWAAGSDVEITAEQDVGGGRRLKILIEKDFECLHPEMTEPGVKFYPHPNRAAK